MSTVSDTTLDSMERDGWTPLQVRALIAAYRELLERNQTALGLTRQILTPGVDYAKRDVAKRIERVLMGGAA